MCNNFVCFIDVINNLFVSTHFSPTGSTEKEKEMEIYMLFLDLLYDAEGLQSSQGILCESNL